MTLAEETTVDELEDTIEDHVEEEPTIEEDEQELEDNEDDEVEDEDEVDSDDEIESDDEMSGDDSEEEVVISIGEESLTPDKKKKNPLLRTMRKDYRELKKENKKLQEQLSAVAGVEEKTTTLGKKPVLEDFDYDNDKFEAELEKWVESKHEVRRAEEAVKAERQAEQDRWQAKIDTYNTAKSKMKVHDFDEAEEAVEDKLDNTQQGIIKAYASNPADIIYALGKYPKSLDQLAKIKDPVAFSIELGKLQTTIKRTVIKRKPTSKPETLLKSSGQKTGSSQSQLDKLRKQALKTGDMTEYLRYKKRINQEKK
eukprot:GHVH01000180.1.p2 GENE.GHVH01000180.1~~GHVH01000180.1.p2  ORF type:complete len:312 (+),score=44.12 GHVH01000180.1:746-1681(+)